MMETPRNVYFVLCAWMLVGSGLRIWLFVSHGMTVDVLPVISILLGLGALVAAFRHRPAPPLSTDRR